MTPLQKAFVKDLEKLKKKYAKGKTAIIEKAKEKAKEGETVDLMGEYEEGNCEKDIFTYVKQKGVKK